MARKNQETNGDANGKTHLIKYPSTTYSNTIHSPKKDEKGFNKRLSPTRMPPTSVMGSSPSSSPRTSPYGLLAGHYAGCKWSEPPLPSALPRPPQHWMQTSLSTTQSSSVRVFVKEASIQQPDLAQQLKVLLNVQA